MQRYSKKAILLILTLFMVLSSALPVLALKSEETRTVRIGYYHTEGYHVEDENGIRSGYGYEVLQAMKLYNNWVYEYVGYDKGWADIQQMILDGEVDMVVSAIKTPARMEIYDFSDRPISQSGACLMVKAGESPYMAGQYESYNGMRIGFIENSSQVASTVAFAEEKGFTYIPVYYKTSSELEAAILSGTEVDAIATSNMRIIADTRRIELFDMKDVYVMVKKGNTELMKEINYALEQISLYSPGLYDSLYNKYYSVDAGDQVFFSPEEQEFISEFKAKGSALRIALVPDMSPYAYYEGDTPKGILYDISSEILRRTGLESQIIITKNNDEYRDLIESKGTDLRLAARFDYNYAEKLGYTLTNPYYNTDVSRVTLKEHDGDIESIAVVRDTPIATQYLPNILNDETVFAYDSVEQCVKALLSGNCDALYLLTRTAQEAVFSDETNRLTSVIMPKFTVSFSIGVSDDIDSRLASILEKASASVNEDDISGMVLKYTDYANQPLSLIGILYSNPLFAIAIVALVLIALFAGVMLVFITGKRRLEREKNLLLQEALASAEQANSAKSVFMSRMSHEIRTPLNAIIGYNSISSNQLASAKSEPEYRQAIMKAMDCLSKSDIASKHLLTVINDVLDMSAIESEKIKMNNEPFDFKNMISSLTTMFFSQAKAKAVDFQVIFDTTTEEWFVGDQMRINQILTNILSNAVKFTPAGGHIYLRISQFDETENTARLHFEISDSGIGMSKEFLSKIWLPFEQADASISRRFGGTGLGLSITKSLVDLMNGDICAESEIDAGSTFKVDIPLKRMGQPAKDHVYDFSGINALVADDDISTCDYVKLLLDRAGAKCKAVTSGKEAVAAVASGIESDNRYTLCIIDWHMPEMDGMATVKRIRELAGPDIPIIIISAYDFSEIEASARAVGVNSFVSKPLFQSTVFDLLANISGGEKGSLAQEEATPDFAGIRILLAEDNRMNMEIAKAMLSRWNIIVDEAWNGKEAVDMFCSSATGTYRAILMDIHMPEIDGYNATQIIRKSSHEEGATIPIIAMTADVFAEDVAEAFAAGMNDHIGKPIEKKLLLETLRKHCIC